MTPFRKKTPMNAAWKILPFLILAACGAAGDAPLENEETESENVFVEDRVVDVNVDLLSADWDKMMENPNEDIYVPATITYDGERLENVGIRIKGNSSRSSVIRDGGTRFSFKIDTDLYVENQELLGVDKLNFNNSFHDPSYLRERITLRLFEAFGVVSPRHAYAKFSINGEYFGLYAVIEQVDKEFLKRHFEDNSGNLYKPELNSGSLRWQGENIENYRDINLKTNEESPDHSALIHFIDVLNNYDAEQFKNEIENILDTEAFLRWLAINTALVILDSYAGSPHNYYLYHDPERGVFTYIPWDVNGAYGVHSCGGSQKVTDEEKLTLSYLEPVCGTLDSKPLIQKVLAVDEYQQRYQALLAELLRDHWNPSAVAAEIALAADLIRESVHADPTSFYDGASFETNLQSDVDSAGKLIFGLQSFVDLRYANLEEQGVLE